MGPRNANVRPTGRRALAFWHGIVLLWVAGMAATVDQSASASGGSSAIQFVDVSEAAGLSGDEYASSGGHGLGINWIDFDGDYWPDLFVVGGRPGHPPHLFRNAGDGTFVRSDHLLPELPEVEMSGSRFADFDRDGDQDLFIYTDHEFFVVPSEKNPPDGPANLLLRNLWVENGRALPSSGPLFVEVAATVGVDDLADPPFGEQPAYRTKTASWLDYDRDGCIDLFVGHLVMNEGGNPANQDRLYRNRCDGTFADATAASGLDPGSNPEGYRAALASAGFHFDEDRWPDLIAINVSFSDPQPYINDIFWRNQGPGEIGEITFVDVTGSMPGVGDDAQAGMGIDIADVDHDGDWDIYITDILRTELDALPLGNVLYLGDGAGGFTDNSAVEAGVDGDTSWGVNFFDADLDGWEDLFVATVASADSRLLYRNDGVDLQGRVTFTNVAADSGLETGDARGSAVADFDRDGDLDLAVVSHMGPLQLFRNDTEATGHWLLLELEGRESNPDAIGTIVEARIGEVVLRRQVKGGSSAHSQDALGVHFGLGNAQVVDEIRVLWPSGAEDRLFDVSVDRSIRLIESLIFGDGFESGDPSGWSIAVQ